MASIDHLNQLEQCLKALDLWQTQPPTAEALASTAPFCVDSLSFPQWLQFILIPRMRTLLVTQQALPDKVAILPYAEEVLKHESQNVQPLLHAIAQFDQSFL